MSTARLPLGTPRPTEVGPEGRWTSVIRREAGWGTPREAPRSAEAEPEATRWDTASARPKPIGAVAHADSGRGPPHDVGPKAEPVETTLIASPHSQVRLDRCTHEGGRARRPDAPGCVRALAVEPSASRRSGDAAGPMSTLARTEARAQPVLRIPEGRLGTVDGCRRRSPPKRRLRGERPRCSNVSRVRQLSRPRRSVALTWARRPADVRCPVDVPPKRHASEAGSHP